MAANGRSQDETKQVPAKLRAEIIERDGSCCRVCGQFVQQPALHHIEYRSSGGGVNGLHVASNLVVVGWYGDHECHISVVHANKRLWVPILLHIAERPGLTGYGVLRAYRKRYA